MLFSKIKFTIIFGGILGFFIIPLVVKADFVGQKTDFFIEPSYDISQRNKISAVLIILNSKAYFYIEQNWWDALNEQERQTKKEVILSLGNEFEKKIYPTLTATFGSEWKPGIDGDERITILLHPLIENAGGYFSSVNEYPKPQNPNSNEREMLYLNANRIGESLLKSQLSHEFLHLITFYQKEKLRGTQEEVWLNEARAEYAPSLLGYDLVYDGSNLQQRVRNFIDNTFNSLTEWENKPYDYGAVNLFIQYLIDYYGIEVLVDSLHSSKSGIASLNKALQKQGFEENFPQIFTDWAIAVFLNDCSYGEKYCYLNPYLKNIRVVPQTNFLPSLGETTLTLINTTKDWAGNWYKIMGGKDILKVDFEANKEARFIVPYLIEDSKGKFSLDLLQLNEAQKGVIYVPGFNKENRSLVIIPLAQTKTSDLEELQPVYQFSFVVSTVKKTPAEEEKALIEKLLAQIEFLKKEIASIQAKMAKMGSTLFSCQKLEHNLYYNLRNNTEVRCLQEFLKAQGPDIYPEGLVTGNFLSLTTKAVIRFQEKYRQDILTPLGLEQGTGFVGPATRAKINKLLKI